ncbi:hypothetical protein [Ichthyenterobacterium magnum]|uniref:Uncharacterized protein n=1 Tax=Ichthyenterobacterium magnum TaxID=1230530 RepID=A0A420DXC0_9FLAO|nr:hypothetical protein [Ichthyenterobacterium magnum]RKE98831.1 hypothetical protein BXY80_0926 [Ichthyenterobacterium magnum]
MYLNFASHCYIKIDNHPKEWHAFLKSSNWYYHCVKSAQDLDLHVEFISKMPFSTQKTLHPKYGSNAHNFIIYDAKKRKVAFDFSKVGVEPTKILVENKFCLDTLEELLFNLVKIVLLGKEIACIHASSYLTSEGAKIIAGWEGIGKSSIMLKKVYSGDSFLSDDRTFISKDGFVFPIYSDVKQYSGEFSSFKELLKHSSFKEKFIIKLNIFLHKIRDNNKSSKLHFGIQKILNVLRRLHLYKIHIPLDKISIGKNEKHELKDVFVLQQVTSKGTDVEKTEVNNIITSLINTTKFDDNEMFKLYQVYKYLFPIQQNDILEDYELKINNILRDGFSKANVSLDTVLLDTPIAKIVKKIKA